MARDDCVNCGKRCDSSWCAKCYSLFTSEERWYIIGWKGAFKFPVGTDNKKFEVHQEMYLMGCADREGQWWQDE